MAPKHDLSEKDAPGKKKARKSLTLEQKMDILRRYDRGESTTAIRNALNLPESMLRTIRKDREKITAAVKAGAGSWSTKVSLGQSNIMVWTEKMLVTWLDHRKRQGLNVTFYDTEKKATECFNHLKQEMSLVPEFNASTGWFYKFYQELLKEKSNPRLKGNRKGIIVKGKEFYIPILNTFPTR